MLGRRRVGAGQEHHPVGDLREAGPDLLAVDDVGVPVALGPRLEGREVGPGVGLGIPLAPNLLAGEDLRQVAPLLRLGAVGGDGRPRHPHAEDVEDGRRPVADHLLVEDQLLHPREPAAAVLLGPGEPEEAGVVELPLPHPPQVVHLGPGDLGDGAGDPVGGEVGGEPRLHFGAKGLLRGSQGEIHARLGSPGQYRQPSRARASAAPARRRVARGSAPRIGAPLLRRSSAECAPSPMAARPRGRAGAPRPRARMSRDRCPAAGAAEAAAI